jgi:hypothetical protein
MESRNVCDITRVERTRAVDREPAKQGMFIAIRAGEEREVCWRKVCYQELNWGPSGHP